MNSSDLIAKIFVLIAFYAFFLIIARPFSESPFGLLLLSTGPIDNLIYLGTLLFLLRSAISGKIYIQRSYGGYAYCCLLLVALLSILLSFSTVQFLPMQVIFWGVTFLAPLTINIIGIKHTFDIHKIARFGIALIVMQILPVIAALPTYLEIGSPDVFGGTWMDADIVAFWGTALMTSALLAAFTGKYASSGNTKLMLLAAVGVILAILSSGKIYSVFIVCTGALTLVTSAVFIHGLIRAKAKFWLLSFIGVAILALAATVATQEKQSIKYWLTYHYDHSHKLVFLDRVFNHISEYGYSDLFGSGPGTLGSRAANAVSGDVLHKDKTYLPEMVLGAPRPEAEIMQGLYEKEFRDKVHLMSATMVIPFSGIGAAKGELGWLGLITILLLILMLYWPAQSLYQPKERWNANFMPILVSISGLSTIPLALFDTVWEQPTIMVFLAVLFLTVKQQNLGMIKDIAPHSSEEC